MEKKGKVLIVCPALDYLGGTELETIITAKVFLENKTANKIVIFSPNKASNFIKSFSNENDIIFQNYPNFFNNKFFQRIEYNIKKIFKFFKYDYNPIQYLFWFSNSIFNKYDFIYVVTSSDQFYYAPIIINFNLKKVIVKFTYVFEYTAWSNLHRAILKKCSAVIVTANSQKLLLKTKFKIDNIEVIDVFIWNEERLSKVSVEIGKKFIFGMLCRISKEKQIEDGIKLIHKLYSLGYNVSLIIKGPSINEQYLEFLNNLINDLNINEFVKLEATPIVPMNVPDFYQNINAFLITSSVEGGPNTGIECMAAGIPVLSYDIGAMRERLEPFKEQLIADDFDSLFEKTQQILNLDVMTYQNLCIDLKKHYKISYSNKKKLNKTINFLTTLK